MAFSKSLNNTSRSEIKTVIAAPKPMNYPPVVTRTQTNQLAPGGAIASAPVKDAPKTASLNDTGTAFNTPIPPGGAPTRYVGK